jgi:hypothetical protein
MTVLNFFIIGEILKTLAIRFYEESEYCISAVGISQYF